jgi:hypothetical protein
LLAAKKHKLTEMHASEIEEYKRQVMSYEEKDTCHMRRRIHVI